MVTKMENDKKNSSFAKFTKDKWIFTSTLISIIAGIVSILLLPSDNLHFFKNYERDEINKIRAIITEFQEDRIENKERIMALAKIIQDSKNLDSASKFALNFS